MMDKASYLQELEKELSGLSNADRQNTLAYYNEFLEDAEAEGQTDPSVLLGSPHTLAAQIKAEIAMGGLGGGSAEYAPPPMTDTGAVPAPDAGAPYSAPIPPAQPAMTPTGAPQEKKKSGLGTIWVVILAIFAIPIGLPLAIALIATIFALLVGLGALLLSFFAVAVSFLAVGVLSCVIGFLLLFSEFAVGLFYLGAGLTTLGLCVLVTMGCWQLAKLCVKGVALAINAIRKKLTKKEGIAQ
jgi:uncharacterized membrane protein